MAWDERFNQFEIAELNLEEGTLLAGDNRCQGNPISEVARDIYLAGGLFQYASKM